jgi:hypothetical protein
MKKFSSQTIVVVEGISLEVSFTYTPGDPGRLYALPKDCYPPEDPEVEIACINLENDLTDITFLLSDEAINTIETYILENAGDL